MVFKLELSFGSNTLKNEVSCHPSTLYFSLIGILFDENENQRLVSWTKRHETFHFMQCVSALQMSQCLNIFQTKIQQLKL